MSETSKNISQVNLRHRGEGVVYGTVHYLPGGECGPRTQEDFQLVLLHSGSMTLTLEEKSVHLDPGQGILLQPGYREHFAFSAKRSSRHSWCSLHPDWIAPEIRQILKIPAEPRPFTPRDTAFLNWGLQDTQALTSSSSSNYYYSQLALALLLGFAQADPNIRPADPNQERFDQVLHYISNEYHQPLKLPDLARAAGVSSQHLLRIFRQLDRPTPMEFLYQYRLDRAQDLLKQTGLPIAEISRQCGFENPYHFSRRFHKTIGLSPRSFRQKIWQ